MTDQFLWLEDLNSQKALDWVQQQNQKTLQHWTQRPRFQELQSQALHIHSQKDKPLTGSVFGGQIYQLWQDAENPLGVFRRAPLASFPDSPQWQTILDLDQYSKEKGEATFLKEWRFLRGSPLVLLSLSPKGKDACQFVEFDLSKMQFVSQGFCTPLQKDEADWVHQDLLLWASSKRPTECGYTSQVFFWQRGSEPKLTFEIPTTSMSVWTMVLHDQKKNPRLFIAHVMNWDEAEYHYWENEEWVPTQLPFKSRVYGLFQDRILLFLEKPWSGFAEGALLVSKQAGKYHSFTAEDFETVFTPSPVKAFQGVATVENGLAISYSDNLKNKIEIWNVGSKREVPVPEGATVQALFSSFEDDQLFTRFQSFTEPPGLYKYESSQWRKVHQSKALFKTDSTTAKQEWAVSRDGTKIPYWVVTNGNFKGPRPAVQLGYGGFLHPYFPFFSNSLGSLWLERGGNFLLAQIRGGSEFGVAWHEAARLENKQKSYDDFIAVSEDAIAKGYTTSSQLAIRGRSNGGLLVGATITQRPDLYGAALIEVPLLDMIRYVELPPGNSWIDEYGDPRDPKFREIILKYSPYQNIEKHSKYPPVLIRTARSDDRVHPGHARKMAAKMQSLGHQVWYFEEELGGHGSTPVRDLALQEALVYEFFWSELDKK